jgi:hypothetical protein
LDLFFKVNPLEEVEASLSLIDEEEDEVVDGSGW